VDDAVAIDEIDCVQPIDWISSRRGLADGVQLRLANRERGGSA
jgi:hypothetical protein